MNRQCKQSCNQLRKWLKKPRPAAGDSGLVYAILQENLVFCISTKLLYKSLIPSANSLEGFSSEQSCRKVSMRATRLLSQFKPHAQCELFLAGFRQLDDAAAPNRYYSRTKQILQPHQADITAAPSSIPSGAPHCRCEEVKAVTVSGSVGPI